MVTFVWSVAVLITAFVFLPSAAFAQQTGAGRPNNPVFAGAANRAASTQTLDLSASIAEAYDKNSLVALPETLAAPAPVHTLLNGTMDYARNGRHVKVAASGGSNARYDSNSHEVLGVSHYVGGGFSVDFARQTMLTVNQTVAYTPTYLYQLFPSLAAPTPGTVNVPAADYALTSPSSYAYGTNVTFSHGLTKRGTFTLDSTYGYAHFTSQTGFPGLKTYGEGAHFSLRTTRNTALRFGYRFGEGQYFGGIRTTEHSVDVGVDYRRQLSPTRGITFGANVSSSLLDSKALIEPAQRQQYRVGGNLLMAYDLGRTWGIQGTYSRTVGSILGFSGPVFNDGASASLNGFLNRRLDASVSAGYSTGGGVSVLYPTTFRTYTGDARLRYALATRWAVYAEYVYYHYAFSHNVQPLPVLSPQLDQSGVRTGLMLRFPLARGNRNPTAN